MNPKPRAFAVLLTIAALALIASGCAAAPPDGADAGPVSSDFVVGGDRPATVRVPVGFSEDEPTPLLVVLHGYSSSGASIESWIHLGDEGVDRGMLVVTPEGSVDSAGDQFWNSAEGDCCDLYNLGVDDSAYLSGLIDEISRRVSVDPDRVFVFGHSNGGFMTYRMACDHADQIAAIVSFAGMIMDEQNCSPTEPVNTLQIHGTADRDVPYNGYSGRRSAEEALETWAAYDGCDLVADTSAALFDLDADIEGAETHSAVYTQGCDPGGSATLWTIEGAPHVPTPSPELAARVLDFLESHPRG
jgi:polyhydroxybutyrate depolymerase